MRENVPAFSNLSLSGSESVHNSLHMKTRMSTFVDTLIATTRDGVLATGSFIIALMLGSIFSSDSALRGGEDASLSFRVLCDLKMGEQREMV